MCCLFKKWAYCLLDPIACKKPLVKRVIIITREKTFRFVLMFYRQATDRLPTHYRLLADRFFG